MSATTAPRPLSDPGANPNGDPDRVRTHRSSSPFSRHNLVATITGGYVPLLLATLVMVLPLLWMMISSFKAPGEILSTDLHVLPENPSLANYEAA